MRDDEAPGPTTPASAPKAPGRLGREAASDLGVGALDGHQVGQSGLELAQADVVDLEGQAKVGRDLLSLDGESRVGELAQIEHRLIVAEKHLLELGVPVEAEATDDRTVEVADQPVGEEERARALVAHTRKEVRPRQHLVAVRAFHARGAELFEDGFEAARGSAVAVNHDQVLVARAQRVQTLAQLVDDAVWIEVQHRRDAIDVHVPAAPVDDVLHLVAESATDYEGGAHETSSR